MIAFGEEVWGGSGGESNDFATENDVSIVSRAAPLAYRSKTTTSSSITMSAWVLVDVREVVEIVGRKRLRRPVMHLGVQGDLTPDHTAKSPITPRRPFPIQRAPRRAADVFVVIEAIKRAGGDRPANPIA